MDKDEFVKNLELAKFDYFRGDAVDVIAARHGLSKWTLRDYIYKGVHGEDPWAKKKKEYRESLQKEAAELAKVNVSQVYRKASELIHTCLEKYEGLVQKDELDLNQLEGLMKILLNSAPGLFKMVSPPSNKPLINFEMNSPRLTEADIQEKLKQRGLYIEADVEESE